MSVCNGERYLREAVESVLAQTFSDFEFLIIDDGSTDRTPEILREFDDPRIRIITNERNEGLTRSLIKGCNEARGKHIARMDADDMSYPTRFQKQVDFLESHPEYSLVGTQCHFLDSIGRVRAASDYCCSDEQIRKDVWQRSPFAHGSTLFVRDDIMACGGYRNLFSCAQDYDLWFRVIENHKVANLPDPLYGLRFHLTSLTLQKLHIQSKFAELAREFARKRLETGSDAIMNGERGEVEKRIAGWYALGTLEKMREGSNSALKLLEFMAPWGAFSDVSVLVLSALCKNPANTRAWQYLFSGPFKSRLYKGLKHRLLSKGSR